MEGLVFKIDSDGTKLQAVFTPNEHSASIDEASVKNALEAAGYSTFFLFNNSISELAARCRAATEPFTFDLGERRHGGFTLTVSDDLMTVSVTITPPYGGNPVSSDEILLALKNAGISSGIRHDVIRGATAACRALNKPIALGRPPETGKDGELLSLIPEMKERCPHPEDDDAVVDYRELGGIITVKQGEPLMRRVPPTQGAPGENVKGEVVPGVGGRDIAFAPVLSGSEVAADDPDLLVAAIAGQPVLVTNGVVVEPTVKVKNIDLSTGNVSLEGSLFVAGDIVSGMIVKTSGDIVVGGTVEAAVLEAGGNIDIKGGTIFAHIHAQGSIVALFSERSHLHASGNIFLRELSMLSELKAGGQIVVGEQGMKKGHVIGGMCRAATLVRALIAGSAAGVPTRIEVGADPDAREKFAAVRKQLEQKLREADELHKAIAYLYARTDGKATDPIKVKENLHSVVESEIAELTRQKKRLQKRLETVADARIEVSGTLFYGVQLAIGEKTLTVDDDLQNVVFRIEDDQIVH